MLRCIIYILDANLVTIHISGHWMNMYLFHPLHHISEFRSYTYVGKLSKTNEGELPCTYVEELIGSGLDPSEIAVIIPNNLQVEFIR